LLALASGFEKAAESIELFEDPAVERSEKGLEYLTQVVVE
jgi:hypothetical protein